MWLGGKAEKGREGFGESYEAGFPVLQPTLPKGSGSDSGNLETTFQGEEDSVPSHPQAALNCIFLVRSRNP